MQSAGSLCLQPPACDRQLNNTMARNGLFSTSKISAHEKQSLTVV